MKYFMLDLLIWVLVYVSMNSLSGQWRSVRLLGFCILSLDSGILTRAVAALRLLVRKRREGA